MAKATVTRTNPAHAPTRRAAMTRRVALPRRSALAVRPC
jgi:hypothetical protein